MYIKCSTRCVFIGVLLFISLVQSQDIFDMLNDVNNHVANKVDYVATKAKETVRQVIKGVRIEKIGIVFS